MDVFNAQGVKQENIYTGNVEEGEHSYQFNSKYEGIYYLRTTINNKTFSKKLVLIGGN